MIQVTCTIIAKNEADRIARTIESVRGIASEILVVDGGSTDGTIALCEKLGARVLENPWTGFGPQKRFAEDHARFDWILNLDADEYLSDDLRGELTGLLATPLSVDRSFRLRTRLVYPGRSTPCLMADFHEYVRLYNRRATRCRNSLTHDEVLATGHVETLRAPVMHRSFRSASHIMSKMIFYAQLQVREYERPRAVSTLRLVYEFPVQFLKYYVVRRHLFGGRAGFVYATTLAFGRWMRLVIRAGW